MTRLVNSVGDRLLRLVVPRITAAATCIPPVGSLCCRGSCCGVLGYRWRCCRPDGGATQCQCVRDTSCG